MEISLFPIGNSFTNLWICHGYVRLPEGNGPLSCLTGCREEAGRGATSVRKGAYKQNQFCPFRSLTLSKALRYYFEDLNFLRNFYRFVQTRNHWRVQ